MAYKRSSLMQERLADNRERILKSARALVAEGGFRQASITAVAARAGLSAGALYRYFPSKADLFVEVLNSAVDHEVAILDAIAARPDPVAVRLRAAVESFSRRALEGPNLAYAFIAEPVDPEVEAARLLCRQRFGDVFRGLLKEGMAQGVFPTQSIDVGAACIVGAFTEALTRPVAPTAKRGADAQLVTDIADFCMRAIGVAAP